MYCGGGGTGATFDSLNSSLHGNNLSNREYLPTSLSKYATNTTST